MVSRLKFGTALATTAAAGLVLGLGLSAALHDASAAPSPAEQVPTRAPAVQAPSGPGFSFVKLAKDVGPAVVNINVKITRQSSGMRGFSFDPFGQFPFPFSGPQYGEGLGSGFFISPDGYLLTNNHVVENATDITVSLTDGRELKGKVVGTDPRTDIALVKVKDKKPFPYVRLGDSDKLQIGEWVVAIGNPFGLDHTVTAGIVSAKGRHNIRPSGRRGLYDYIQTDASINPGNSGGPLINVNGEVIGINAAVNTQGQGIGFAIPINMAKTLVPMFKAHGKVERSFMGVQLQDVSHELAKSMGLPNTNGAIIARVVPGSPAQKAGLKPGDVIISFEGKTVKSSSDIAWLASTAGAGKTVNVGITGPNGKRNVKVKLETMPEQEQLAGRDRNLPGSKGAMPTSIGVEVTRVTPEIAQELSLDHAVGVVVTAVDRQSSAAGALQRGDVIVSVDNHEVKTEKDFDNATSRLRSGNTVRMLIIRDGMPMWLAFTI